MISELSFLIDLLLNHKLSKPVRDLLSTRIKDVEANMNMPAPRIQRPQGPAQAASTMALMAKHPDLVPVEMPPVPVEQIAQTPETAAAMNARNQAINNAITGKAEKGRTSPRKW